MQYFTMGVSETDANKKKDKKGSKKALKYETKAQKVPAAMKTNNMGQHDQTASKEASVENIQRPTDGSHDSAEKQKDHPDVSIDVAGG